MKKRWFEANEMNDEDIGGIEAFEEPGYFKTAVGQIVKASTYVLALKAFNKAYHNNQLYDEENDISYVPAGNGSFEGWWTGSLEDDDLVVQPLNRTITLDDVKYLAKKSPEDLGSLFFNIFYSGAITRGFDADAFEFLVRWALSGADPSGDGTDRELIEEGDVNIEGIDADNIIARALEAFADDGDEDEDELFEAWRHRDPDAQKYFIEAILRDFHFEDRK